MTTSSRHISGNGERSEDTRAILQGGLRWRNNGSMEPIEAFLARWGGAPPAPLADLESILKSMWEAARATWPDIGLSANDYATHLAYVLSPHEAALDGLRIRAGRASDLFLAAACGVETPGAHRALEQHFLQPTARRLAALERISELEDELIQRLRVRLLVRQGDGTSARVTTYTGLASLETWIRTVASRITSDILREQARRQTVSLASEILDRTDSRPNPEIEYLKMRYRQAFQSALATAMGAIDSRGSTLLQLHFLQGVPIEALAKMYQVNWRTIYRWIEAARREVLDRTRRHLAVAAQLDAGHLDTMMRMLQTQITINVAEALLKGDDAKEDGEANLRNQK